MNIVKNLFRRRANDAGASDKERVTVHAYRSFPLVGERHLVVHAPRQAKDVLFHASLKELRNVRLSIEVKEDGSLLRFTSAGNGVIAGFSFRDAEQARETADAVARAIRPRRARYVLGAAAAAVAVSLLTPTPQSGGTAYSAAPALAQPLPASPQIVRPQAAGDASESTAPPKGAVTDINDPFGLKVVPK